MKLDTAIIFAGGKSSRMGEDKALLPFKEYSTLAEYQYSRLLKIFNNVYISAKSNKFNFSVKVIEDRYVQSSPLVALISIFETLDIDEVFILGVDVPFIDRDIIKRLYSCASLSKDIIVAISPNGIEPLCGIYKRAILPIAQNLLSADNHRLNNLLNSCNSQFIYFNSRDKFLNLNTPDDYNRAVIRS
jgi:molybdopterin-guanine dinucleotide biosynthesis protein A